MEGHRLDDEENRGMEYRPYRPQVFDEGEDAPASPPDDEPLGTAEFHIEHSIEPADASTFEAGVGADHEPEPDFASLKFQRENTLLTNAESYAASIREEAQLYVRQLRSEVDSLNRQAEQRYEEAERIKAEAQAEAERIVAEADAQLEETREQARLEGFEAGREEGLKQRHEEASPQLERMEAILQEIGQFRKRVAFYTEKDGVRLALLIAKKILQTELKINKQVITKLLANTLARLEGKGTFRVWLNPEDYQFATAARPTLERFLDEEQALTLRAKPDLRPGNVLIETDREVIDLTFQSQFYHLEQQLSQTLSERESLLLQQRAPGRSGLDIKPPAGRTAARRQPGHPPARQPRPASDAATPGSAGGKGPAKPERPSHGG
ncbi:MAG TPA: FliH/SctL family protein [bacterium]|nr:FliH/SctL family protein [bacterium]